MTTDTETLDARAQLEAWMQKHSVTVTFDRTGIKYSNGEHGFTASFCFRGTVKRSDAWHSFDYSGGCCAFLPENFREVWRKKNPRPAVINEASDIALECILGFRPGRRAGDCPGTRMAYQRMYDASKPDAASLLDSLKLDASCADQSFEQWADEFGYGSDSRKAESIYRACQDARRELLRVIGRQAFAELMDLESL